MASNWRDMTLGDLVSLQRGYDLPEAKREPGIVPVIGSGGINGFHSVARAKGPGVTIGRSGVGSMGVVTYSGCDYWPHNTTLFVTDFRGNDERFVYYFLKTLGLRRFDSGSAQASLNRNYLYPIPIRVPLIVEQRQIARTLGALDDKIEQNRRSGRALEELARATFKAWFVDFEPVKAKAAGAMSFPGMRHAIFAALPDRLADSSLGPVPQGWEVRTLEEVAESVKGLSYKGAGLVSSDAEDHTGSLPLHNLNSVYEGGGYKNEGIKRYSGEFKDRHVISPGDLIVANTEQGHEYRLIGFPAIVPKRFGERGLFSHHLFRVRSLPKSPLSVQFLYHAIMSARIRDEIVGCTNGTTVNMLSIDGLKRPHLCVPNRESAVEFEQRASEMYELSESLLNESSKLATLRDYLLPRLLSGRVRVREAERAMEEVA